MNGKLGLLFCAVILAALTIYHFYGRDKSPVVNTGDERIIILTDIVEAAHNLVNASGTLMDSAESQRHMDRLSLGLNAYSRRFGDSMFVKTVLRIQADVNKPVGDRGGSYWQARTIEHHITEYRAYMDSCLSDSFSHLMGERD